MSLLFYNFPLHYLCSFRMFKIFLQLNSAVEKKVFSFAFHCRRFFFSILSKLQRLWKKKIREKFRTFQNFEKEEEISSFLESPDRVLFRNTLQIHKKIVRVKNASPKNSILAPPTRAFHFKLLKILLMIKTRMLGNLCEAS